MPSAHVLSEKEFAAICALTGPDRYKHFLKRVADWESVWGLRNELGWVFAADAEDRSGFPVWPHPDYAAACAINEWAGNVPTPIEVYEFVENWLPNMAAEKVALVVFPTAELHGVMVGASELQEHLRQELSQYE